MGIYDRDYYRQGGARSYFGSPRSVVVVIILVNVALWLADGILQLRPWAVDVSSGVEAAKGLKDPQKIHQFVAAVRQADERLAKSHHVRIPAT